MKSIFTLLTLLASWLVMTVSATADTLSAFQPITIKGNIYFDPTSGKPKSKTATIANILSVLGITGQDPKNLQFYYDSTTNAVVIAAKGIASGSNTGTGTPVATVVALTSTANWQQTTQSYFDTGTATALDANLSGSYTDTLTIKSKGKVKYLDTITFISWGSISSVKFIFKGTINGVVKPA